MRKKLLCLLLALSLLLCACGNQPQAQGGSEKPAEEVALSDGMNPSDGTGTAVGQESEASPDTGGADALNTDASHTNSASPVKTPQNTPTVNGTVSAASGEPSADSPKEPIQNPTPENGKIIVSLSIDCKNAIAYGILDNPNFADILPQNGIIYANGQLEAEEGESVLSLLKRTLKANNMVYSIQNSSGYVRGIAGLSEFDCGQQSGWMYKVNGKLPNFSCKYYDLQAGDRVEFVYTCRMGDVVED